MNLKERRNKLFAELNGLAATDNPTDEQRARFDVLEAEIGRIDRTLALQETRDNQPVPTEPVAPVANGLVPGNGGGEQRSQEPGRQPAITVNEPDMYGKYGQRSWFGDLTLSQRYGNQGATERMDRHAAIERERAEKRSVLAWRGAAQPEGMEVRTGGAVMEIERGAHGGVESRGLTAGTNSAGGYLVPPADLQDLYVEERKNTAIAASLVTNLPLPDGCQLIRLPKLASSTAVGVHTEGNTITKTNAAFGQAVATVYRLLGGQDIANYLHDRANPAIDVLIMNAHAGESSELLDFLAAHGTNSGQPMGLTKFAELNSKVVTYDDVTPTYPELYPKITKAINAVVGDAKRWPTGALYAPRRVGWMQGQVDTTGRPFLGAFAPQNALGESLVAAHEGLRTSIGGVPAYADGNMRINNGVGVDQDDIIVAYFPDQILWSSPVMFAASAHEKFSSDQTVIKVGQDIAFMPDRRVGAVWVVEGTGLNAVA
ncbi:MAG: phage major capsid protein [Thermoleophilia bacterium]|nr:phage major capsid protein [Thermoleophilia bacterium]